MLACSSHPRAHVGSSPHWSIVVEIGMIETILVFILNLFIVASGVYHGVIR